MSYSKLFKSYLWLKFLKLVQYRISFFFGLIANLVNLIITITFWGIIFHYTTQINGWTYAQIIALNGFFVLFLGIFWFFFNFSENLDRLIIHGKMDLLLCRPFNVLVAYMFQSTDWMALMDVIQGLIYLFIATELGLHMSLINFLGALVMIFLGAIILSLIFITISSVGFWVGKTNAIFVLWDSIWDIGPYPLTIFPIKIQLFFTFLIPLIFLQTYPTLLTTTSIPLAFFVKNVLIELFLIAFWFLVSSAMWKKGLRRYSSYGG